MTFTLNGVSMPTAVPAVDRAAAVIRLLSERPYEPLALSDIARATNIHKATCAAILGALLNQKMVSRDGLRRYSLGPEFVRLGYAYTERFKAFSMGRSEMWKLAEKLGVSCSATIVDGDEMIILDIFGDTNPPHVPQRIGRRIPLEPPLGTIFKAWSSSAEIDAWLENMQREFAGDRASQLAVLSAIRTRGFSLGSEQDFHVELDAALRRLARQDNDTRGLSVAIMVADKIRNYQDLEATDSGAEVVNYLVGPVFDREANVVMSVNLFGKARQIRRRDLPRLGRQLLMTTDKITRLIGGSYPPDTIFAGAGDREVVG